jgi:tetratricopeptide (TPR) repeat protein
MRRPIFLGLLPFVLLIDPVHLVRGDDQPNWVGHQVMAKSSRSRPRVGGAASSKSIICVRTVGRIKSDWLWVGDGWLRQTEVVPLEDAVDWFTAQIKQQPSAFNFVSRAAAHCTQGDYEHAAADCTAALAINPRFDAAHYYRAAARAEQGRFTDAISDYTAAIRLNPRLAGAYLDRGAARLKSGDYRGSLADVNSALRLSPRTPDAYYVRGVARYHLHQYHAALADLNIALRSNPGRAVAYDIRGACREELGQVAEAIEDFDRAIELDPANVSAHSHRDKIRVARAHTN